MLPGPRWLACGVQFVGLPFVVERGMRWFLSRTHGALSGPDKAVLSQRATRAIVALSLAAGALTVLTSPPHASLDVLATSDLGSYLELGTVVYYCFDTLLLAAQRSTSYDLWAHHFFAIGSFAYMLASGAGEQGAMFILLCETLVPWGFLLFYFKLNKLVAHPAFKVITVGGLMTLLGRISIFGFLLYRLWWVEHNRAPSTLLWMGWLFLAQLGLDVYWIRLYLSNFRAHSKAKAALNGAPAPSLFSVFQPKKR